MIFSADLGIERCVPAGLSGSFIFAMSAFTQVAMASADRSKNQNHLSLEIFYDFPFNSPRKLYGWWPETS